MLREFRDGQGINWKVWDVYPSLRQNLGESEGGSSTSPAGYLNPAFAEGWLCFDCGEQKRRHAGIPRGWEDWDALALEQICGRATPTTIEAGDAP